MKAAWPSTVKSSSTSSDASSYSPLNQDFDEYGQTIVLDLASKYQPKDQDELIDIMNHLADKLKDSSPSVTLSTVKVLIKFIDYDKDLFDQVMLKVKAPLIALVVSQYEFDFQPATFGGSNTFWPMPSA